MQAAALCAPTGGATSALNAMAKPGRRHTGSVRRTGSAESVATLYVTGANKFCGSAVDIPMGALLR